MSAPTTVTLPVHGMTCGGCESSVARALSRVPGVVAVRPSHPDKRVEIDVGAPTPSRDALVKAIEGAGFDVPADR